MSESAFWVGMSIPLGVLIGLTVNKTFDAVARTYRFRAWAERRDHRRARRYYALGSWLKKVSKRAIKLGIAIDPYTRGGEK